MKTSVRGAKTAHRLTKALRAGKSLTTKLLVQAKEKSTRSNRGKTMKAMRLQAVNERKEECAAVSVAEVTETSSPTADGNVKMGQATLVALAVLSVAPDAFAAGGFGDVGILQGRTIALLHPAAMYSLLITTAYTGYLGWQWRRVRTIGDDIAELKKAKKPAKKLVTANGSEESAEPVAMSPVDLEIESLTSTRKELIAGKFKDKHFALSSLLLGSGVFFSIEGCLNTFTRTGKLFPGPHLWAGAGITALWAIGAALVPQMQKGSKVAKDTHVALNALAFLLFLWQVPTGMDIVYKVFQFTKWP